MFESPFLFQEKRVFRFKTIEFWAEPGRVAVLDYVKAENGETTSVYRTLDPMQFLKNAMALAAFAEGQPPQDRLAALRAFENAQRVAREAIRRAPDDNPLKIKYTREQVKRMLDEMGVRKSLILPGSTSSRPEGQKKWVLVPKFPSDQIEKTLAYGYNIAEVSTEPSQNDSSTSAANSANS